VRAQVERVVQAAGENLMDELTRVPGVRAEHDATDRLVVGRLRAADDQRAVPLRGGGGGFWPC
jgi:hypothetical protein